MTDKRGLDRHGRRGIIREMIRVLLLVALVLIAAGTIRWPVAWLYGGWLMAKLLMGVAVLHRHNPELLNRRGRIQAGAKKFDKSILAAIFILIYATSVVCGLSHRFGLGAPVWWPVLGWLLTLSAEIIILWAMVVNTHFEGLIRIQADRGHSVCDSGPYRFIRHPGYLGMILGVMAPPFILQSWWGLIPAGAAAILFIIRTALEDAALKQELEGYLDFTAKTGYRLFPGVW